MLHQHYFCTAAAETAYKFGELAQARVPASDGPCRYWGARRCLTLARERSRAVNWCAVTSRLETVATARGATEVAA
jgi:hypothetical protein